MFILGKFLYAFAVILNYLIVAYTWIIIIAALVSWVNPDPFNPIVRFLYGITEPFLGAIRRIIPLRIGMIDLTPIIAILLLQFLKIFLVRTLFEMAARIG